MGALGRCRVMRSPYIAGTLQMIALVLGARWLGSLNRVP